MDDQWMQEAIALAATGMEQDGGGPFGALVVQGDQVLGRGSNRVTVDRDPTAHAEMVAIRAACQVVGDFQLKGSVLYTTCEPCPMCLGAIYWARLDGVVYAANRHDATDAGFDDSLIYREIALPDADRTPEFRQCLRDEALDLFQRWKQNPNRVEY